MSEHPNPTELSSAVVTFLTTEHFTLQTARSAATAETNGQAARFLSSVSSGLVALAFISQVARIGVRRPGVTVFGSRLPGC